MDRVIPRSTPPSMPVIHEHKLMRIRPDASFKAYNMFESKTVIEPLDMKRAMTRVSSDPLMEVTVTSTPTKNRKDTKAHTDKFAPEETLAFQDSDVPAYALKDVLGSLQQLYQPSKKSAGPKDEKMSRQQRRRLKRQQVKERKRRIR